MKEPEDRATPSPRWTPEVFRDRDGSSPFERFIDELSDEKFIALDAAIERVLLVRGIDLARTEWLKPLGKGLHEFRVRHDADEIARMFGGEPLDAAASARSCFAPSSTSTGRD